MDTPKKSVTPEKVNGVNTSLSNFEDSPVFNFINNLSPIKPVKSLCISQAYQSMNFSSPPLVFSTPHVNKTKESKPHSRIDEVVNSAVIITKNDSTAITSSMEAKALLLQECEQKLCVSVTACENQPIPASYPQSSSFGSFHTGSRPDSREVYPPIQQKGTKEYDWEAMLLDPGDLFSDSPNKACELENLVSNPEVCIPSDATSMEYSEVVEDQKMISELDHRPPVRYSDDPSTSTIVSNTCRGVRRRCLDYELPGDAKRRLIETQNEQSKSIISGIGLHLNALAITPKESMSPMLDSIAKPSCLASVERVLQCSKNLDLTLEDASQICSYGSPEDANPSSPKKKRRKYDGEGDACKRCNCKKSKCLKLYCECFAAGVYCMDSCSCQDCFNKPIHEQTVIATRKQIESRNPLAFAPKVIRSSESAAEVGVETKTTPASARHKRGCNCKKSNCLKKYCECFQGGVGCSVGCRCEGCKNTFGRKDGSASQETENLRENESEEATENISQHDPMPLTPISFPRTMIPTRCTSRIVIGSSSGLYGHQVYDKSSEFPLLLQPNYTTPAVMTISPNGKRVSPPQRSFEESPGLRSGRKLILQSIPSFPSLTPQH